MSKAVAVYALHYLSGAITTLSGSSSDKRDAFHGLSEGYGFVMSLQFTNDGTDTPYFTKSEVDSYLQQIDNFYTVEISTLQTIHDEIKLKFDL